MLQDIIALTVVSASAFFLVYKIVPKKRSEKTSTQNKRNGCGSSGRCSGCR